MLSTATCCLSSDMTTEAGIESIVEAGFSRTNLADQEDVCLYNKHDTIRIL